MFSSSRYPRYKAHFNACVIMWTVTSQVELQIKKIIKFKKKLWKTMQLRSYIYFFLFSFLFFFSYRLKYNIQINISRMNFLTSLTVVDRNKQSKIGHTLIWEGSTPRKAMLVLCGSPLEMKKKICIIIIIVVNCLLNQYAYKKKRKERKERRGGKRIHIKRFLMTDRMQG